MISRLSATMVLSGLLMNTPSGVSRKRILDRLLRIGSDHHPAKPLLLPDPVHEEQAFRRSITENGYAMFDGKVGMNGVHRCIQSAIESNIAFLARPERHATTVEWLRLSLEAA